MEIFHISAECYSVAKLGGLVDLVGTLPKHQNKVDHIVITVISIYDKSLSF